MKKWLGNVKEWIGDWVIVVVVILISVYTVVAYGQDDIDVIDPHSGHPTLTLTTTTSSTTSTTLQIATQGDSTVPSGKTQTIVKPEEYCLFTPTGYKRAAENKDLSCKRYYRKIFRGAKRSGNKVLLCWLADPCSRTSLK